MGSRLVVARSAGALSRSLPCRGAAVAPSLAGRGGRRPLALPVVAAASCAGGSAALSPPPRPPLPLLRPGARPPPSPRWVRPPSRHHRGRRCPRRGRAPSPAGRGGWRPGCGPVAPCRLARCRGLGRPPPPPRLSSPLLLQPPLLGWPLRLGPLGAAVSFPPPCAPPGVSSPAAPASRRVLGLFPLLRTRALCPPVFRDPPPLRHQLRRTVWGVPPRPSPVQPPRRLPRRRTVVALASAPGLRHLVPLPLWPHALAYRRGPGGGGDHGSYPLPRCGRRPPPFWSGVRRRPLARPAAPAALGGLGRPLAAAAAAVALAAAAGPRPARRGS